MREMKFRIWNNSNKSFSYVDLGDLQETVKTLNSYLNYFSSDYLKGEPIDQYTGLIDKNGVEIYEGDICKPVGYGMTYFRTGAVELFIDPRGENIMRWTFAGSHNFEDGHNYEIIGNIHKENK